MSTLPGDRTPQQCRQSPLLLAHAGDSVGPADEPPAAPSSRSSSTEDFCYVFVVELERGPSGLGMGLIDGLHTPLGAPGLYIQTLLPGSPAASDGRLSLGDRILEVNGSSLAGVSYLRYPPPSCCSHQGSPWPMSRSHPDPVLGVREQRCSAQLAPSTSEHTAAPPGGPLRGCVTAG